MKHEIAVIGTKKGYEEYTADVKDSKQYIKVSTIKQIKANDGWCGYVKLNNTAKSNRLQEELNKKLGFKNK